MSGSNNYFINNVTDSGNNNDMNTNGNNNNANDLSNSSRSRKSVRRLGNGDNNRILTSPLSPNKGSKAGIHFKEIPKKGCIMCSTCGIVQTHKIERNGFGVKKAKKIPLTVEGKVINGTCINCHPMGPLVLQGAIPVDLDQEDDQRRGRVLNHQTTGDVDDSNAWIEYHNNNNNNNNNRPPSNPMDVMPKAQLRGSAWNNGNSNLMNSNGESEIRIPRVLDVIDRSGDDCTVVSGITMDHHLLREYGTDDGFDSDDDIADDKLTGRFKVAPGQRRPQQSFLGETDDDCPPPNAPRRTLLPTVRASMGSLKNATIIKPSSTFLYQSKEGEKGGGGGLQHAALTQSIEIVGPTPIETDVYKIQEETYTDDEAKAEIKPISLSSVEQDESEKNKGIDQERKMPSSDNSVAVGNVGMNQSNSSLPSSSDHINEHQILTEIRPLLDCLKSESRQSYREEALQSLTEIVWKFGTKAKLAIARNNGIEYITNSMWASMDEACVQEASAHLLFALSASTDANAKNDVLIQQYAAGGAVDALLIAMQQHLSVESIQNSGCGALSCLASASLNNTQVDDGTLTGAVLTVILAMDAHRTSKRVQEWGLRALYNQCVYSSNAESNRRAFATTTGTGVNGPQVIHRALQTANADVSRDNIVTIELVCRLYWCLSSSEDVVNSIISETPLAFQEIVHVIQNYYVDPDGSAVELLEAAFGALGNFFNLTNTQNQNKNRDELHHDATIIFYVVESLRFNPNNEGLCLEGCALIANFLSSSTANNIMREYTSSEPPNSADTKTAATATKREKNDAISIVEAIFTALQTFPESFQLFDEATRSLTCLSMIDIPELDDVRRYITSHESLAFYSQVSKSQHGNISGQLTMCQLIGSILLEQENAERALANSCLNLVLTAMENHPMERGIQESACSTLRNLSCYKRPEIIMHLTGKPMELLLDAMRNHRISEMIQLNGCCALWNFVSKLPEVLDNTTSSTQVVDAIVETIKSNLESGKILEMACATLWSLLDSSNERKQRMVDSGGIDAVTCVIVMHPTEPSTLERACGVLSSVSTSPIFAHAIAKEDAVGNIVEVMRANAAASIGLLEVGALVLRNIILACPEYVTAASNVAATIINHMKLNPNAVCFQREACNLLWAMAALSKVCREKILSLDGFAVLVGCLEHNSSHSDVYDAALGAFNQLTI